MENISNFLLQYKFIWITIHAIAAAIGLGAATVTDVTFFNFLKDGNINLWENKIFKLLTKIIWTVLWIILITGLLIFLGDIETYSSSTKFILKMTVVVVLFFNGILINKYLHRRIRHLNFADRQSQWVKHIAFASGAVSIVSWYIAFFLGMQKDVPVDIQTGLFIYGYILLFAISISQIFCNHFQNKALKKKNIELAKRKAEVAKEKKKLEKKKPTKKKIVPKKKPAAKKKPAKKKTSKS